MTNTSFRQLLFLFALIPLDISNVVDGKIFSARKVKSSSDTGATFPESGDDSPTLKDLLGSGGVGNLSSNTIDIIVHCKKKGEFAAKSATVKAKKINAEIPSKNGDSYFGLTVSADEAEKLVNDPDCDVDVDSEVHVTRKLPRLRKLEETIPWGIPTVLQDMAFWNEIADPTGEVMKVCVADTGYNLGHEDLPVGSDVDGTNSSGNGSWNTDGHGHGTHCSGTVCALGGNDKGVPGVIPNNKGGKFQLLIGKALSDSGSGTSSGVLAAVSGCINQGAKVVSLSLGGGGFSQTTSDFYKEHYEDGVLFVAAAGNSGNSNLGYPASYASLMSVASLKEPASNPTRSSFSQYNDQVEISAPGSLVLSTLPNNNYDAWSGTSMATPHVAGVAGLIWMYFPQCTNIQIRHVLSETSKDLGDGGCEDQYGFGLVQAKDAYDLLSEGNCGGDLGPTEPVGGCGELYGTPAPTPAPCTSDAGCDDGNLCTTDSCDTSTGECSHNAVDTGAVEVSVTTDNYFTETSWEIIRGMDNSKVMSGGGYTSTGGPFTETDDLFACGFSYTFTIKDQYGDGICCSYGNGGYSVSVEGSVVAEGGDFGSEESTEFTIGSTGPTPPTSPVATPITPPTAAPVSTPILTEMLNAVNAERSNEGLGALCYNNKLIDAAQIHSDDMAGGGFLSHTGSDGSSPFQRMTDAGFNWNSAAENIAAGQQTVESVMTAWMNSPGHKANILGVSSKYFGLGLTYSSNTTPYWTQVFANSQSESCSSVAPVSTPVSAPVSTNSPTIAPITPPTNAPITPPTNAPVTPPTNAPVIPPTDAPVASPTDAPVTPPTNAPITPPTNAPVTPPTNAPVASPTAPSCVMFIITLNTDAFGYETSFTLINDNTGGIRLAGGAYASSKSFDEITCLDNGRYIFTVSDEHGDGMCCDNGQGGYKLTLGGEVVKSGGGFGQSESFVVEIGPQGPSRAPTPAPTCTQQGGVCTFGESCCSGRCGNNSCE